MSIRLFRQKKVPFDEADCARVTKMSIATAEVKKLESESSIAHAIATDLEEQSKKVRRPLFATQLTSRTCFRTNAARTHPFAGEAAASLGSAQCESYGEREEAADTAMPL